METGKNIMVCVTKQKTCERLIKRGAQLRDFYKGELFVIHVTKEGWNFLGESKDGDALEFLFQKAKNYGANLTVVRSNNVLETLEDLVRKNGIHRIVLGESYEDSQPKNIVKALEERLPKEITIDIIPPKEKKKVI